MDYKKLLKEGELLELSLIEGKMHYLLTEEISQGDIDKMDKSLGDAREKLRDLITQAKRSGLSLPGPVQSYAESLSAAVDKAASALTAIELDDPESTAEKAKAFFGQKADMSGIMRAVTAIQNKATEFHGGLAGAVAQLQGVVSRFEYDDEQSKKPIKDIFGTGSFPPTDKLTVAFKKNLEKPESWLSKIPGAGLVKGLKKIFQGGSGIEDKILSDIGELPNFADLADSIMGLTPAQIAQLGTIAAETMRDPPDPPPQDVIDDIGGDAEVSPSDETAQPDADASDGTDAPPASDEEASVEVDNSDDALRDAAADAASDVTSPLDAALDAIQGWHDGLSKSSQSALKAKARLDGLKTGVKGSLEAAADTVSSQVRDAVSAWRAEHEEPLMKSKRFAKKNFDSLENLIPQLAAGMMKQMGESHRALNHTAIRRNVFRLLDKRFAHELRTDLMPESFSVPGANRQRLAEMLRNPEMPALAGHYEVDNSDKSMQRWAKLAGLIDE